MKKRIRAVIVMLTALVFLGSSAMVAYQHYQYYLGEQAYAQAEELAGMPDLAAIETQMELPFVDPDVLPEVPVPMAGEPGESAAQTEPEESEPVAWVDPYAEVLAAMDFKALQQVNGDVLGWILIPGTPVSYPLVQGEDNDEYLDTTWRGSRSSVGSIFLECRNSRDLSDFNTMIYGHRTQNRSMFGSLKDYASQNYWQEHPCLYITDESGCSTYRVFAAYEVEVTGLTYRLGFEDDTDKQEFLDFCTAQSVIRTGIVPTAEDRIVTLSTCTGFGHDTRWVVQAVRS